MLKCLMWKICFRCRHAMKLFVVHCIHNLLLDAFSSHSGQHQNFHFHNTNFHRDLRKIFIFCLTTATCINNMNAEREREKDKHLCLCNILWSGHFGLLGSYCMSICVENEHLFRHHRHSINIHTKWSFSLTSVHFDCIVVSIIWFCRLRCHLFRGFLSLQECVCVCSHHASTLMLRNCPEKAQSDCKHGKHSYGLLCLLTLRQSFNDVEWHKFLLFFVSRWICFAWCQRTSPGSES